MRIGVIGAGLQGGTLAKKLAKAGHEVRVANTRGPESLKEFAKQTATIASALEDAATKSELIIIAIPFKNIPSLPKPLFKDQPDSTTIVDVSNYYPSWRDGQIPEVEAGLSESEWVEKKVATIIDDLGFDALDIGPLSESWRQQPGTPAYCTDLDLESLKAAVKAADRRAAPEKREEGSRAMVDLGPNATPLEKVKAYRRSLG